MNRLSISAAWDETRAFLGREGRIVVPIALATFALPSVLANWRAPFGSAGRAGGLDLLQMFVLFLFATIGQMAISALAAGWRGSVGESLRRAASRVWGVVGAIVIVTLPIVLIGATLLGFVLVSAGVTDPAMVTPQFLEQHPLALLVVTVLMVMLIALFTRLALIDVTAMTETARPIALIRRSLALSKANFWRLLAVLMLAGVAAWLLDAAIRSVVGAVLVVAVGPIAPFSLSALIVALLAAAASTLIGAVMATLYGRIYAQLAGGAAGVPDVERAA